LAVKKKIIGGGRTINVGIYGRFRVGTNHPGFHFEEVFYCEPPDNTICETCKFKFKCFTDEEVIVAFKGKTLGIFPKWWCKPRPDAAELERFLFGKRTHLMTCREFGGKDKIEYESNS